MRFICRSHANNSNNLLKIIDTTNSDLFKFDRNGNLIFIMERSGCAHPQISYDCMSKRPVAYIDDYTISFSKPVSVNNDGIYYLGSIISFPDISQKYSAIQISHPSIDSEATFLTFAFMPNHLNDCITNGIFVNGMYIIDTSLAYSMRYPNICCTATKEASCFSLFKSSDESCTYSSMSNDLSIVLSTHSNSIFFNDTIIDTSSPILELANNLAIEYRIDNSYPDYQPTLSLDTITCGESSGYLYLLPISIPDSANNFNIKVIGSRKYKIEFMNTNINQWTPLDSLSNPCNFAELYLRIPMFSCDKISAIDITLS